MNTDKILKKNIEDWFYHLRANGVPPNEAAARAIQVGQVKIEKNGVRQQKFGVKRLKFC